MEIGTHCALPSCSRLSFLPINCTYCKATFCEDHHLPDKHACASPAPAVAGTSKPSAPNRKTCELAGCKAFTLEVDTSGRPGFTHAAPKCERCHGSFCMAHRSFAAHQCTASAVVTEGQRKILDADERKRKAQAILAKNFPNRNKAKPK